MYKLTAADFADTGQWRLLLNIGVKGIEAFLENTLHPEIELQELCKVSWEGNRESLCKNLEEAVYNNPRLLDDFATRIVMFDSRTLFVPKELAEASAGAEEELYGEIYKAEDKDIMIDSDGSLTAVWSLAPGVKSFLMRTFPGARLTCNLLQKIREEREKMKAVEKSESISSNVEPEIEIKLLKDIREGEIDLILMQGNALLSASTHTWETKRDIDKLITSLATAYGLSFSKEAVGNIQIIEPHTTLS